jgi:endonuclease YncB( thermonuclease family)
LTDRREMGRRGSRSRNWPRKTRQNNVTSIARRRRGPLKIETFFVALIVAGTFGFFAVDPPSTADLAPLLSKSPASTAGSAPIQDVIEGRATVIDGDTVEIAGQRVRFNGIDAPESAQLCKDAAGKNYQCGQTSANALDGWLAKSRPLRCSFVEWDRYDRFVGDCSRADGELVAMWLVRSGHAMDWPRHSDGTYADMQAEAWAARRGIWQGEVQPPWEWRAASQQALATEVSTPTRLMSGSCEIKGNISAKGERIYHVPGQKYYDETAISPGKGERWFCSEADARCRVATGKAVI